MGRRPEPGIGSYYLKEREGKKTMDKIQKKKLLTTADLTVL